jgi:hypothetical protein
LLTLQESVDEPPAAIEAGLALKLEMTGAGARTVTVVAAVVVPPAPVAVNVYVVVSVGVTATDVPPTAPTPWSMEIDVALATDHRRVVVCPGATVGESAVNELITGAGGVPFWELPLEQAASRSSAGTRACRMVMAFLPALRRGR